jgi:hypothetical protein
LRSEFSAGLKCLSTDGGRAPLSIAWSRHPGHAAESPTAGDQRAALEAGSRKGDPALLKRLSNALALRMEDLVDG